MEEDDPFGDIDIDSFDEFGSLADERYKQTLPPVFQIICSLRQKCSSFGDEFVHSEDRAALLELTEEIASIEAEIQLLKDTKQDLHKDSSSPGYSSHPTVLDALKSSSSSLR